MGKLSDDPRTYLREAVALAQQVFVDPGDRDKAFKLAIKVEALDEAMSHGKFKLVRK